MRGWGFQTYFIIFVARGIPFIACAIIGITIMEGRRTQMQSVATHFKTNYFHINKEVVIAYLDLDESALKYDLTLNHTNTIKCFLITILNHKKV